MKKFVYFLDLFKEEWAAQVLNGIRPMNAQQQQQAQQQAMINRLKSDAAVLMQNSLAEQYLMERWVVNSWNISYKKFI